MANRRGKVEAVADFTFLGSKITVDGDFRYEIQRCLFLGRKVMTNLDSISKSRRHYFADKGPSSQSYGFSSSHVGMWQCVWAFPQSCLTLCGPMDSSPPGSSVHRIFQVRILEWFAISYSTASPRPRNWTCISLHFLRWQAVLLPLFHLGRCYWCWQLDYKEHHRIDAFELWCWRRL